VVTTKKRRTAYRLLLKELPEPLRALPKRALADLLRMWHDGLVRQVTSFPTDMRIERWMFEQCPGIQRAQMTALAEQLRENEMVLRPKVQALTARTLPWRRRVAASRRRATLASVLAGVGLGGSELEPPCAASFWFAFAWSPCLVPAIR